MKQSYYLLSVEKKKEKLLMKLMILILIIKSRWKLRFPWLPLSIRPYHPSLPVGISNYIPCPYRADVNKFLLL